MFCLLLTMLQAFWTNALSNHDLDLLNLLVPVLLGMSSSLLAWQIMRQSPLAIWNPLVWFLLACTMYYGLGQLIHIFGNTDSVERVNSLYLVDQPGLARTNLLHTVGVMIIVGAYVLAATLFKQQKRTAMSDAGSQAFERQSAREARSAALLFLLIGLPIKYLLELPYNLGLLTWVLPGSVQYLGTLSGMAIIPLYWLYKKRGGIYGPIILALVISEFLVDLVSLSKLEMIKTAIFLLLGTQLVKPGLKKLVLSGIMIVVGYVLIASPFVNFARVAVGRAAAKDLWQAVDLVEQFNAKGRTVQDVQFPKAQLWWARLAYSNVELFAMRQYDRGHPGATFKLAPYTLIPRFIFPNKPRMNSGLEFTFLITGDQNMMSQTGLGALGEGYWNGGWLGVAVVGIVVGVLLAAFSHFSMRMLESRIFMFLPISMAGIMLGLRIDDWFVPTYLGTTIQLLLVYLAIQYVVRPIQLGNLAHVEHAVQRDGAGYGGETTSASCLPALGTRSAPPSSIPGTQ
ncbi:hypothetical protein AYO43_00100 [Nitrospira sp. SCGC AG-212-E16]|nr:hypothetical protein AYO43_00100 [Nitrospira sp. SCGC AG-212-E16]